MNLLDIFESVNEGWSDAIVSQRTGKPRTPYSVYIKGKKWKDFENDDHAEAVANKLRAKFKADGRDPSVITIAATDYDKGMAEGTDQTKQVFKDKAGKPVGEIGIDPESSPGNGEWYVYHYATGYSVVGFDSAAEAKRELMYVHKHPEAVEGHPSTKEQGVAEVYTPAPSKPFRNPRGFNKQGTGVGNKLADLNRKEWEEKKKKEQGVNEADRDVETTIRKIMSQVHVDGGGGNLSYMIGLKAPTMDALRDRYHDDVNAILTQASPKELAQAANELSSAFGQGVAEVAPPGAKAERMVKHIKKSLSKDGHLSDQDKAIAYATTWKAHNDGKVEEAQTDYQKRRQRERDIDAGKPVSRQPKNPQTDYAKKRAQDKRDMELGEGEREPYQQAIDQLTARRIDDLNMKLDDLVQRAKSEKNPEVKAALAKEFRKHKAERDSYFGIDPATGMNASGTLGTVKGALDEVGTVTHTATGLKHQARPDTYGGYEEEPDHLARLDKHAVNRADKALGVKFDREKKYQGGLDIDENNSASAPIKHRVAVTVSDPKHPDMDVMQRTCRVTGPDREKAINSAIAHYRREGFKVHDHHYIGVVDEGSMARAADNSEGPKFRGYWKGTNPNPPNPGQGFGGCEEAENPMGQKELDYLIAKAKGTKSKPDPDLHKGDEHEIGYGQELAEKDVEESMGPLGKITKHMAKSTWATTPSTKYELRKRRNPEQMAKRNGIAPIAEAKGLSKQVKIVQGPDAGKIGRIREIKLGAYKGAPKTYYIDLDDGGQANNLLGTALRLVKSEMNEGLKKGEYYVWTVYFDDGSSKRIKVPSDEFDPYEYYKKQNKVVVNVDYSWDIQGQ